MLAGTPHPVVKRAWTYHAIHYREDSSTREQKIINKQARQLVDFATELVINGEELKYDMGRAIATIDKMGEAIHTLRVAFALDKI